MLIKRETNSELLIAYFRVSTKKRGVSGLGLEGQQAAVNAYARANNGVIVKPYTEVESGKRSDRSQLRAALSHARCIGATLVVAKLDRLSRNVAFLSSLMESKVDFVACDNPHATKLALHILVAVAEAEAEAISQRTRAGLAAYKARGGLLGASLPQCRNLTDAARLKSAKSGGEAVHQKALAAYEHILPMMRELRQPAKRCNPSPIISTPKDTPRGVATRGATFKSSLFWNVSRIDKNRPCGHDLGAARLTAHLNSEQARFP